MTDIQKRLRKAFGSKGTVVTIPWRKCNDVPNFLKRLAAHQKAARKTKLIVR